MKNEYKILIGKP